MEIRGRLRDGTAGDASLRCTSLPDQALCSLLQRRKSWEANQFTDCGRLLVDTA
jgi:hypothetical protein